MMGDRNFTGELYSISLTPHGVSKILEKEVSEEDGLIEIKVWNECEEMIPFRVDSRCIIRLDSGENLDDPIKLFEWFFEQPDEVCYRIRMDLLPDRNQPTSILIYSPGPPP